jgi:glycerophosphoryl diester phosphodiesterase
MRKTFVLAVFLLGASGAIPAQTIDGLLAKKPGGPLICGHRGGFYGDLPENSLAAIEHTVASCAPVPVIVEFDLRRSKDGTLFILHDATLERTTSGQGTLSEASDVYLNSLFLKKSNGELSDQKIPTFENILRYAETKNVLLMLDSKEDVWAEAIQKLAARKLARKSIVLTFTPEDSTKIAGLSREVRISCLIRSAKDWEAMRARSIPREQIIAYVDKKTDLELIGQLRAAGIPVMADVSENASGRTYPFPADFYTDLMQRLRLDILITDFPVDVVKTR